MALVEELLHRELAAFSRLQIARRILRKNSIKAAG
jgi:hypothetical protein